MILDKQNVFCTALDVKSSSRVPSTTIDQVLAGDAVEGAELELRIQVTTAFTRAAGAVDTVFSLETSATDSFGSAATVLWQSGVIAKALLVAGYTITVPLPRGALRFLNVVTDNVNAADAANISAFLVKNAPTG